MTASSDQRRGVLYAFAAYGYWGLIPLYFAFVTTVPAFEMLAHRIVWTATALLPLVLGLGLWGEVRAAVANRRTLLTLMATAGCIGGNWVIFMWAVTHERVLETSLGYFINPLIYVLLGVVVLGERLRVLQVVSVVLAAAGVCNLVFQTGTLPWVSLALPLLFALYGLLRKHVQVHTFAALFLEAAMMAPFGLAYGLYLIGSGEAHFPGESLPMLLWFIGLGPTTLIPLSLFGAAAKRVTLTVLGFCQYIAPTMTFLLGVFFFREDFDLVQLIAFGFIWASLVVFSYDGLRAPREPAVEPVPLES